MSTESKPGLKILSCRIVEAIVADPQAPLNVRLEPNSRAEIIERLDNGTRILISGEQDDWFHIDRPVKGWVFRELTRYTCNELESRIDFAENGGSLKITDAFIGGGEHKYYLNCTKGQTLRLESYARIGIPTVEAPDGTSLVGELNDSPHEWNQILDADGDYKLSYHSNFKGYEYNFSVELND
jgi:Bacterial SH3 domain